MFKRAHYFNYIPSFWIFKPKRRSLKLSTLLDLNQGPGAYKALALPTELRVEIFIANFGNILQTHNYIFP